MHPILMCLVGLALLLVGGRLLVNASIDTARRLRVSPLVVGLTLVAWGTSAPELALNLSSALKGRGELALGNVLGANICNMALVLGVCALLRPLVVQERLIRVEIILNACVLCAMAGIGLAIGFDRWLSVVLIAVFLAYSVWTIRGARRESTTTLGAADAAMGTPPTVEALPMGWGMIGACFVGGLALLGVGGSLASDGVSALAIATGIPPAVVGVTVVSVGTTLPELVTGVLAVRKGQTDLAMGNAIGSCLFNACAIFGLTGLVSPPAWSPDFVVPLIAMGILALAMIPVSLTFHRTVSRLEGGLLVAGYAVFLAIMAVREMGA